MAKKVTGAVHIKTSMLALGFRPQHIGRQCAACHAVVRFVINNNAARS